MNLWATIEVYMNSVRRTKLDAEIDGGQSSKPAHSSTNYHTKFNFYHYCQVCWVCKLLRSTIMIVEDAFGQWPLANLLEGTWVSNACKQLIAASLQTIQTAIVFWGNGVTWDESVGLPLFTWQLNMAFCQNLAIWVSNLWADRGMCVCVCVCSLLTLVRLSKVMQVR